MNFLVFVSQTWREQEIGNDKVQGMDYYYTLQGWIKGVNQPGSNPENDLGEDAFADVNNLNQYIGKDRMAYTLGYNEADYTPILVPAMNNQWNDVGLDILSKDPNGPKGLFNGNIALMTTDLNHFGDVDGMRTMAYQYDALHRIKQARAYGWDGSNWTTANVNDNTAYSYDPNGNLLSLTRGATAYSQTIDMDNLTYNFTTPHPVTNEPTNLLSSITDLISTTPIAGDADYLGDVQGMHTYTYDKIGNLISDQNGVAGTNINGIDWTVYGKVARVYNQSVEDVLYTYDANGNRLSKEKEVSGTERTYYVRDASGNVMSIYDLNSDNDDTGNIAFQFGDLTQKEVPLYGSSRLGMRQFTEPRQMPMGTEPTTPTPMPYERSRGNRHYELSNHLGNVLTTVSDKKTGVPSTTDPEIAETYEANVLMASDYYPFGLQMPGRKHNEPDYRYGFNGKENSEGSEWGTQLVQDYGFRLYNPGIGRFLSVDPLAGEFPFYSPYQFAGNMPIQAIDLDGLEPVVKDGFLVGYIVQKRQGPTQILADLYSPITQKERGYTISNNFEWTDIVYSNIHKFANVFEGKGKAFDEHNMDYTGGNIHPGNYLNLPCQNCGKTFDNSNKKAKIKTTSNIIAYISNPLSDFRLFFRMKLKE